MIERGHGDHALFSGSSLTEKSSDDTMNLKEYGKGQLYYEKETGGSSKHTFFAERLQQAK